VTDSPKTLNTPATPDSSDTNHPANRAEVRVVAYRGDVALDAARLFTACAKAAVAKRSRCAVALSGGSTPPLLFQMLAGNGTVEFVASVPWPHLHVFWGDERHVPPTDPQSNYRMARETLLDHVPIPSAQIHRMPAEDPDAAGAARAYEAAIRADFNLDDDGVPVFDIMLLGMGTDGHTASIFPGSTVLGERDRLVVAPWVPRLETYRLTMTPPVILGARTTIVLVSGADKADALHSAIEDADDPARCPIQILRRSSGRVVWIVDRAAAARLRA